MHRIGDAKQLDDRLKYESSRVILLPPFAKPIFGKASITLGLNARISEILIWAPRLVLWLANRGEGASVDRRIPSRAAR